MDKRTFLALLLTAAVIVLTPMVFRSKTPPPVPAAVSARPSTTVPGAPTPTPPADTIPATAAPPGAPAATAAPATAAATRAVRADTTSVTVGKATYALMSAGAAPTSVTLADYVSRRPDGSRGSRATLTSAPAPLVRYRLSLGARPDVIDLDTIPFTATRAGDAVTFTSATTPRVTIRYQLAADGYVTHVTGELAGASPDALRGAQLLVDLPTGLRSQEADTLDDLGHLAYAFKPLREDVRTVSYGKLEPTVARTDSGPFSWVATRNKYFVVALMTPPSATPFTTLRMSGAPKVGKVAPHAAATATLPLTDGRFALDLYAGPQSWSALRAAGSQLENVNPYGGWIPGVQALATICMRVLLWMRTTLNVSYGWVLIIFGVTIRLLLWPLNQSAMRSSLKMQRLQPELMEIQKKYRSDPERLRDESMKVYAAHGTSPFAQLGGCLPMLLPMPVLFALFFVFQNTIEFRGVSFLWLPDLSLRDPLYIMPLFMGVSMFFLSWIGMRSAPPNPQAKMMSYMMPVVMTVVLINFPSGLNLYYAVQNIAALPQQWLIGRERSKAGPMPAPAPLRGKRATT